MHRSCASGMSALFHSIRWRVQAWHGGILLVVILAFCFTTHRLAWQNQFRHIDRNLVRTERTLFRAFLEAAESRPVTPPTAGKLPKPPAQVLSLLRAGTFTVPTDVAALFEGVEPGHAYFSLRDRDGRVLLESDNAPADLDFLPVPATEFNEDLRIRNHHREMLRSSSEGLLTVVGLDITTEREEMRRFAWSLGAVGIGVWLLGLLGGWWLAGRAIQPIDTISRTATRIAGGNLRERISISRTDSELDQLSRVLNRTFDRLQATIEQQKQFTAGASHELRTPVTILLSETQRALKREREPDEYRAILQTCHDTAGRMRRLVESLLLLAQQENSGTEIPREPCDLSAIVRESAVHIQALANERQVAVRCDFAPAPCQGNAAALSILATNLIANAIEHRDRNGGVVDVTCGVRDGQAMLTVVDDGPGIPAADLPHIFERFYRVDKSRTQTTGHTGLGLALARTIVENHGGMITAVNNPARGARFTVLLPGPAHGT